MPFDERSSLTVTRPTLTMRFSRYQKVTVTLKVSSAVSAVVPSVSLSASVSVCSAESPPAAAPDFSTAPTDEFLSGEVLSSRMSADIAIADTSDSDGRSSMSTVSSETIPDCDVIAAAATVAIANTPITAASATVTIPLVRGAVSSAEIRLLLRLATLLPT